MVATRTAFGEALAALGDVRPDVEPRHDALDMASIATAAAELTAGHDA